MSPSAPPVVRVSGHAPIYKRKPSLFKSQCHTATWGHAFPVSSSHPVKLAQDMALHTLTDMKRHHTAPVLLESSRPFDRLM